MCLTVQVRFGEGPSEKCRKVTRWRPTLPHEQFGEGPSEKCRKVTRRRSTLLPVRFGRGRLDSLAPKGLAAYLIG